MDPLYEYLVTINYHFIGVVVAGIMIGTLFIFGFLYYFYVEKTLLIAYTSLYFLFVFLGLLSSSFVIVSKTDGFNFLNTQKSYTLNLLFDYLIVYSIFLIATFILSKPLFILRIILLFVLTGSLILSFLLSQQWLFFLLYLYLLMGYCIYLTFLEMKHSSIAYGLLLMVSFLVFIIYFTLRYTIVLNSVSMVTFEWIMSIVLVISIIIYFMYRYKKILSEKKLLYTRLTHDFLTEIYSKTYFLEVLGQTQKGIILFVDINQFKWINDEFGHYTGDEVLKNFASKLTKLANDHFLACRFGGDEFAILLTNISIEESQFFATVLMNDFKETLKDVGIEQLLQVGISIGLSTFTNFHGPEALSKADMAMYDSKSQGNYKLNIHLEERGGLI